MLQADIPSRFPIPFGNSAAAPYIRAIPTASQIGIQAGAASLTDGFPPVTFLPIGAGGTPAFGEDFNGILNQATAWNRWQGAGGQVTYDATFATGAGGYPKGAIVASTTAPDYFWLNLVDSNFSDPDAGGANWQSFSVLGGTTGDMKFRPTSETLYGWIKANATTIGNASSNATQRANADTLNNFTWHWTNFSNTECPVFTSAGAPSTRGASAAADFAANKRIQILDWRGVGPKGLDDMGSTAAGAYSGVPFTLGNATTPGSVAGENTHALVIAELAAHSHGVTDPTHVHAKTDPGHNHSNLAKSGNISDTPTASTAWYYQTSPSGTNIANTINTVSNTTGISYAAASTGISINSTGSGTAHNTVDVSMLGTWYIRL